MKNNEWSELENKIVKCHLCPRLVNYREAIAKEKKRSYREWDYWGKPVPGFGDHQGRILIVGLAPGAHRGTSTSETTCFNTSSSSLGPARPPLSNVLAT